MMAEFLGKDTGYCRGRGGSMHIADVTANNLGRKWYRWWRAATCCGCRSCNPNEKTSQVRLTVLVMAPLMKVSSMNP